MNIWIKRGIYIALAVNIVMLSALKVFSQKTEIPDDCKKYLPNFSYIPQNLSIELKECLSQMDRE